MRSRLCTWAQMQNGVQVRPADLDMILQALAPYVQPRHLIISIAAGVRLATLEARLPEATRVVGRPRRSPCVHQTFGSSAYHGIHHHQGCCLMQSAASAWQAANQDAPILRRPSDSSRSVSARMCRATS